ncbi:hypothetical protein GCM10009827_027810 [Dactylosporangium maewongense]|uniref:Uncharacterized protein n=1 Tax=Dactylosporangium maewongense TaxID=634393 RepID=A0ABP4L0J0_9ACTN
MPDEEDQHQPAPDPAQDGGHPSGGQRDGGQQRSGGEQDRQQQDGTGRARRDRKRRRAIRAHAAQTGVAYSVAARQLAGFGVGPGETLASLGRTVYPVGLPGRWTVIARELRPAAVKLHDTRRAARLAGGRAVHLVERFPPGESHAGPCYAGDGLEDLLAMLYLVVVREAPGLVPAALDLAWTAELGEETAVDMECAEVDRAARLVLDDGIAGLWARVEDALRSGQANPSPAIRHDADRLSLVCRMFTMPVEGPDGEPYVLRAPWTGAAQILDALLVIADDGHAPGTRVRLTHPATPGPAAGTTTPAPPAPGTTTQARSQPREVTQVRQPAGKADQGRPEAREAAQDPPAAGAPLPGPPASGTIIGARWAAAGPPRGYEIRLDGDPATHTMRPEDLIVLPRQESTATALQV